MEKEWKEEYLLKLVEAVTKVEDKLTKKNTKRLRNFFVEEEKWEQVAAKMPFSVLIELNYLGPTQYRNFPSICKWKFIEICEYFNDVFMRSLRNNCLTKALMKILAEYSMGFPDQPLVSNTGHQVKYIKTDRKIIEAAVDSANSSRTDCSSRVQDNSRKLSRRQTAVNHHDSLHFRNPGHQESTALVVHTPSRNPEQSPLESDQHCSLVVRHTRQQGSTAQIPAPVKQLQQGNFIEKNSDFEQVEFVKKMSRSQVVSGYLLTLPSDFCNTNLAQYQQEKRVPLELVDEDSVTWRVQYIPTGHRVSGGWIAFAKKHRLQVDDVLRFRLIKSQTFQVTVMNRAEISKSTQEHPKSAN